MIELYLRHVAALETELSTKTGKLKVKALA